MARTKSLVTEVFAESLKKRDPMQDLIDKLTNEQKQAVPEIEDVLAKAKAATAQIQKVKQKPHLVCNACNKDYVRDAAPADNVDAVCGYTVVRDTATGEIISGAGAIEAYVNSKEE